MSSHSCCESSTQAASGGRCACWRLKSKMTWSKWQSSHPDEALRSRQYTEWIEFTKPAKEGESNLTGMTQGVLRLQPNGMLPIHHHPEPYAETYYFISGNGHVNMSTEKVPAGPDGKSLERADPNSELEVFKIYPGLHIEIPARVIHGIEAGSEGCEFIWTFGNAPKWSNIPYIYVDPDLPCRNMPETCMTEPPGKKRRLGQVEG
eukprot:TRINITY_DN85627_c0_g1_i1.p1 TRINITY_DN85627_c0_g1~~TRINITY_DN85627_c0_g1_i1.p1  ORF type:complete len:205 (+),score=13.68 TRINITY_DN85627_c0_g1_i1:38-652(+)